MTVEIPKEETLTNPAETEAAAPAAGEGESEGAASSEETAE